MLEINKCGMCGKAFVGREGYRGVCEDCREEEQDLYDRLRSLLRDNDERRFSVEEAARILRTDEHKVRYLVKKGLVQLVPNDISAQSR